MNYRLSCRGNRRHIFRLCAFILTFLYACVGHARPDMSPLGPNIADKGSAFYHFTAYDIDSADGKRHYRVWTGVPNKQPPAAGYPVLYMLDGNAVMDRLSDDLLGKLAAAQPPVLVVIGYQTNLPFDLYARAYDYTPAAEQPGQNNRGRPGGGSAVFRQLLIGSIVPRAEQNLNIDRHKRGLWGHSLGGIFVLDSYVSPAFFNVYYATSPSLNQNYVGLLKKLADVNPRADCDKPLYLLEGSGAAERNSAAPTPEAGNKVRTTLEALHTHGVPAAYVAYPGYSHGQMFNVGFQHALLNFSGSQPGAETATCQR